MISVTGPPGVVIQVLDGAYNLLARGAETLEARLAQGLYIVRWIAPDSTREEVVWLKPLKRALKVPYPIQPAAADAAASERLAPIRMELGHTGHDSAIMVVERSDTPGLSGRLSRGLRLFNPGDVAMRSDSRAVDAAHELPGEADRDWTLRTYPVDPGVYRLRYEGCYGETLEQSVPALAGRRTVVLLRQGVGQTLVSQGEAVSPVTFAGVEPSRTVIVTAPLQQPTRQDPDQQRLAEALLGALAAGSEVLNTAGLERIQAPGSDPLLGLYAAAVILEALASGRSPALDDPGSPNEDRAAFEARWRQTALRLLEALPPELAADRDLLAGAEGGLGQAPPLLASAWRRIGTIEPSQAPAGLRGALVGVASAGPWLAWRAAAAKGGEVAPAPRSPPGPIAQSVEFLTGLGQLGLSGLGSLAGGLILRNALPGPRADVPASLPPRRPPARRSPPPPAEISAQGIPPVDQPVVNFDDPNKGRFGGRDSLDGFSVTADFAAGSDPAWVTLTLAVTAAPAAGLGRNDTAIFVLHDSFTPQRVQRPFVDRVARLVVEAYGGFTVGVWLPRQKLALELDLAALPGAPEVIRDL
jgi:hypothetical protein